MFIFITRIGEETKNPKKSIPISVIVSLSIIFAAYFTLSTVLTMMLPYYEQNADAPLVMVFRHYNWIVAEYIVSIGAVFGLCASLMGSMFPLPRVIYAMSIDGLLFHFMGAIHPRFKTPMIGTLLAGFLTGVKSETHLSMTETYIFCVRRYVGGYFQPKPIGQYDVDWNATCLFDGGCVCNATEIRENRPGRKG